ncbi:transcription initiation factor TFIID subunit 8 [Bicyclus anynana]|uniref:Transcription initiation factor TFIID subunit 8 n=1 Tax=Bicyclus anynana TaxID=110368 RepID=A0A6J1MRG3_BICAN|nr:transcription initiation factor TFIID subunit 8 [Bicyclus anynana]
MTENTEKPESSCDARRRILNIAVSTVLLETGFESSDRIALETLTEVIQCFFTEVGNSAKSYCELTGRTEPVLGDVMMALINMGISVQGIEQYAARPKRHVIQPPQQASVPRTPAMLSAGSKAKPPPHIPFHLPPLPDPHAYIRTPTHKQPVTEYEAIREKAASQKKDIERALTKFLAKTSETHNLFNTDDNQVYPLIACKPTFPPYLSCLLPTDQVFDFDELEYHFQVANRTEDLPADKKDQSDNEGDNGGDNENSSQPEIIDIPMSSPERLKSGG